MVRKLKKPSTGGNGQADLISKAKKMQEAMLEIQDNLKNEFIEHTAAGGAIKIKVNGQKKLIDISISDEILKEAVEEKDTKLLTDVLVPAIQQAMDEAEELAEKKMEEVTGGISIPGLF